MRRVAVTLTIFLTAALMPAHVSAGTHDTRDPSDRAGTWFRLPEQKRDAFWTRGRIAGARPVRFSPELTYRPTAARAVPQPTSPATGTEPTYPAGYSPAAKRSKWGPSRTLQSHVDFTRSEITDPSVYPYVTHGRLFSLYPGGILSSCSATIVTSAGSNLVVTAAHCLYHPNFARFPQAVSFAPGYRFGDAPFDYWTAESIAVSDQWKGSIDRGVLDPRFDFGVVVVSPDAQGQEIADLLGARGVRFNLSSIQQFDSFGYPAAPPFDGERLYSCESEGSISDGSFPSGPFPVGMGCDMTQGSSGGGWVVQDTYLNSVVSYSYPDHSGLQFGPYFGNAAEGLYEQAAGIDAEPPSDNGAPELSGVGDRPDPFSPNRDGKKDRVTLFWRLSKASSMTVSIHTKRGRRVRTLGADVPTQPGGWKVPWNGRNAKGRVVRSGTYVYKIVAEDGGGRDVARGRTRVRR